MRFILAIVLSWISLSAPAWAERRVGLVVGNDRYDELSEGEQLHNAVNDARAVKAALEQLKFEVDIGENLDRKQFIEKLSDFGGRLQSGDIAFFFYAGHGVSFSGANYLLPRDIPQPRADARDEESRLADLAVAETRVVERIRAAGARVAVVVLDACRDNPLAPPGGRSIGGERGLEPPPQTRGVLTIYSAGAGEKATDLGEGNSLFTGVLVKQLTTPGLGVRDIAFRTQGEVAALAAQRGFVQEPGVYSQIIGDDVYLAGAPAAVPTTEDTLAKLIDAASPEALAALLAALPRGPLKERAKERAAALKKTQTANLAPEPPKPTATSGSGPRKYRLPEGAALVPQLGHVDGVFSVAYSPDGARIASASSDKTVKLWDAASGRLLRTFEGHAGTVNFVAFSPDGLRIASGSDDKTVKLWDTASGRLLRTFEGQKGQKSWFSSVAFSPDGARIASGCGDNGVKLWDASSGRLLRTFRGHLDSVFSVAFSFDGARLASASYDKTVKLWDAASGRLLRTFEGHSGSVSSVAFSPDGARIASGSDDKTVKLWDAASGRLLRTFEGHSGSVSSVAFSPDGARIASGSDDQTVKLWDAASGRLLRTFEGHRNRWVSVAFSPDGARITSGSFDNSVKLWDAAAGALIATVFAVDGHGVAYTPDGLFVTDADPRAAFAIVRGTEELPLDNFIALNRRDSLAEAIAEVTTAK